MPQAELAVTATVALVPLTILGLITQVRRKSEPAQPAKLVLTPVHRFTAQVDNILPPIAV